MTLRSGVLFQSFKYFIYALLAVNTGYFFLENFSSSGFTYEDGVGPGEIIVAYTDAIDTAAWLVLLILLELETWVIPDEKLKGWLDGALSLLSFICWVVILYSFYGYAASAGLPLGFEAYAGPDPCGLVATGASFAHTLDEYELLNAENCRTLAANIFFNPSANMFASGENLSLMKRLVWTDVLNAGVWVLIVVILELEIYSNRRNSWARRFMLRISRSRCFCISSCSSTPPIGLCLARPGMRGMRFCGWLRSSSLR